MLSYIFKLTSKYDENCSALEQMGPSLTGELEVRRLLVSKCNQLAQKMQDACLIVRDQETSSPVDDAVWKKIEELYLLTISCRIWFPRFLLWHLFS